MFQLDYLDYFYSQLFDKRFQIHRFLNGGTVSDANYRIFSANEQTCQILFYEPEPLVPGITEGYLDYFKLPYIELDIQEMKKKRPIIYNDFYTLENIEKLRELDDLHILVTSEKSKYLDQCVNKWKLKSLYYFFHAFTAFDWYRGFNLINANKPVVQQYEYDFISFNRLVRNDRSYRIYFVAKLAEQKLLGNGQVSFALDSEYGTWKDEIQDPYTKMSAHAKKISVKNLINMASPMVIDDHEITGSASADISPLTKKCFWNIVTETVFYYEKLHLTEKIFKPIVSKQPFMLLAAPGNLAYLRSYGFKTFGDVIDESYDDIQDNDARIDAVVAQMKWYSTLTDKDKLDVMKKLEPVIEYNFHHFYGNFRSIVTDELINNVKKLYQEINYSDNNIPYQQIQQSLIY